ncbi:hypothetical protein ACFL6X_06995 [Candidatus Latescibacterota bacterium]
MRREFAMVSALVGGGVSALLLLASSLACSESKPTTYTEYDLEWHAYCVEAFLREETDGKFGVDWDSLEHRDPCGVEIFGQAKWDELLAKEKSDAMYRLSDLELQQWMESGYTLAWLCDRDRSRGVPAPRCGRVTVMNSDGWIYTVEEDGSVSYIWNREWDE